MGALLSRAASWLAGSPAPPPAYLSPAHLQRPLAPAEMAHLVEHGFVVLRGVIPPRLIDRALRAINGRLGELYVPVRNAERAAREAGAGVQVATDALVAQRVAASVAAAAQIGSSEAVLSVLHESPLWSAVESVIGRGSLSRVGGCQVSFSA